jgi:hypothetical protein
MVSLTAMHWHNPGDPGSKKRPVGMFGTCIPPPVPAARELPQRSHPAIKTPPNCPHRRGIEIGSIVLSRSAFWSECEIVGNFGK